MRKRKRQSIDDDLARERLLQQQQSANFHDAVPVRVRHPCHQHHGQAEAMRQHVRTVGYTTMMRAFFDDMFLEGSDPSVKEYIVSRALALPEAVGASLFSRLIRWDAQYMDAALSQVAVPLLAIQSTYINPERVRVQLQVGATTPWLELVRHHVPTAQIEIVSGAGHFTMLDKPQAVNQLLASFVASVCHSV